MKLFPILLGVALSAATAFAQAPAGTPAPSGNQSALPIFRATLPGGTYEVAIRAIIAVTSHEYVVDAAARVTEVNIDTTGQLLARFYYIEPVTPNTPLGVGNAALEQAQRLAREALEKTGQDVWKKVVKNYPTTTHARTVEYRLESKEHLNSLYTKAEEAFRLQRDTRVTIGEKSE
jgi:hypothetical protein